MKALLFFSALMALMGCGNGLAEPAGTVGGDSVAADSITLDEAIGEMLLVGFRGTEIDSTNPIWRDIRDYHVGSVILFDYDAPTGSRGRNIKSPEQVKILCSQLKALDSTLLIGIDQEGGMVSRLSPRYGFTAVLSPQKSAQQGFKSVRQNARLTAGMLRYLGINLNFAPVADVDVNPACPVIGKLERSFSADTSVVTECCAIWMEEQRRQGVASCLKHFPGHGSAKGDTHKGLVDVTGTWQPCELAPYRALADCDMVMTAHVINRRLDPAGLPASLSPAITSLLRDSLGFQGVIITDDLAMGAVADHYTLEETLLMALNAGADLLCLSNNGSRYDPDLVPKVVAVIRRLIDKGSVDPARILLSASRIRSLKGKIAK